MEVLDEILREMHCKNHDEDIRQELLRSRKSVLIYGVGAHADKILEKSYKWGLEPEAFVVDDNYFDTVKAEKPIPIQKMSECNLEDANVLVGFINVERTRNVLQKQNFFCFWNVEEQYLWTERFILDNRANIEYAYEMLYDDHSKKTLLNLIRSNLSGDVAYILPLSDDRQYFNEITEDTRKEYFVDCGAFNGDTLRKMISHSGERFCGATCFEPDTQNYSALVKMSKLYGNVQCINRGCWKDEATLYFREMGSAGQIVGSEDATTRVDVTTIDSACRDQNVTFIKMDIEGAERSAIIGARETIERCIPKLAICCYHKADDIWRLMRLIDEIKDGYRFYLRHHSNGICETVLYAIPTGEDSK